MWLKIDDAFTGHPKVVGLSDRAFRLHVTGMCHCSQHLTDGRVKKVVARQMGAARKLLEELMDAGLWIEHEAEWEIHDYLSYNPSRAKVLADREAAAERKRKFMEKKNGAGNGVPNADETPSGTHHPTRPDPARQGQGRVSEEPSAMPPAPAAEGGAGSTLDEETVRRNVEQARAARRSLRSVS